MSDAQADVPLRRNPLVRLFSAVFSAVTWLLVAIGAAWAFGALWFDFPDRNLSHWVAAGFSVVVVLVAVFLRPRWRAKLVMALGIVLVMVWWFTLQPRQYRDWKTDVALLPHAVTDGDEITIHNIRNFDYRSPTDFTPRYDMRKYHLSNLEAADVFINYWGYPHMAHPVVSFDFGTEGRICFSIETRPEKGESYSALGGLYRQFELICVAADERDVIRLRSNYREGEDVYLYRLKAPRVREAFMGYLGTINELRETPRWYNAITNNCTTAIRHQRASSDRAPWDWRMLVNGYGDQLLYEREGIDTTMPFPELRKLSLINARAKAADQDPNFSTRIRESLPGM
jgi:hypothetical protein